MHYLDYKKTRLGQDETKGRFANVTIETCVHCGTVWLCYHVEDEFEERSGRWFRGILTDAARKDMTPEKAIQYIEGLDWYIYGGSYYETSGKYGNGRAFYS